MKVKSYNGDLISVILFKMDVLELIQITSCALFSLLALFTLIWTVKRKRDLVTRKPWPDLPILILLVEILLILVNLMKILTKIEIPWSSVISLSLSFLCKLIMLCKNDPIWRLEKVLNLKILTVEFAVMLYNMGFRYSQVLLI